jgi:UDP-N-acetylmuramoylalanine--D-glutamate ligase
LDYYLDFSVGWFGKLEGSLIMSVLVAGLGISGQAALNFLVAQGDAVYAFDTRENFDYAALEQRFPNVKFATGTLPKNWMAQVTMLVLSPGIDPNVAWVQSLLERGVSLVGEVELFCRALPANKPVIAITGSNGKSTVTTLVGELLKAQGYSVAVGGNLGTPALDLLLQQEDADVFVLELSSFQLETTHSMLASTATVLNISPDHLDRYGAMAAYIAAKAPIYSMTRLAVVNLDDTIAANLCPVFVPQLRFGLQPPQQPGDYGVSLVDGKEHLSVWLPETREPTSWLATERLSVIGRHNISNVLAALALCQPLGLTQGVAAQVLTNFSGLPHRAQLIRTVNGVRWVNDSKGTNVGSTVSALMSLGAQSKIVLLAGGQGKGQAFAPLAEPLKQYGRALIVFGQDALQIAQACQTSCTTHVVADLDAAVALAQTLAQMGDTVLLSPACASFDQFNSYVHRGEVFAQLVEQLL